MTYVLAIVWCCFLFYLGYRLGKSKVNSEWQERCVFLARQVTFYRELSESRLRRLSRKPKDKGVYADGNSTVY